MRIELLNCPFCGGKAVLEDSHRAFIKGETTKVAFIRCRECNARSGRVNLADYGHTSKSMKANLEAANSWNRRVIESDECRGCPFIINRACWEKDDEGLQCGWVCSECGEKACRQHRFCPNCGTEMIVDGE